ncbi:hypothetical protein HELRODRAFT_182758 [Helobdella robusta]|uniref:Protein Wnt n=1 Tax=Helobdella robusta TaxID=6412 RepID=T1FIP3_HELRO|nr:hypothetical protein HELRODRAFT_182758 [Helobdella robusta]ESN90157.1 hypothetical protein HELRODRAFT_182758 [Helobdella robusta]
MKVTIGGQHKPMFLIYFKGTLGKTFPISNAKHIALSDESCGRWIAYSDEKDPILRPSDCYKRRWLEGRQKNACKKNFDMVESIKIGARQSIDQCQKQFVGRRWNCSVVKKGNVFGKILNFGTRESAFVHALSAAGLAYSVTKTCSSGQLDRCGCDNSNHRKFDHQLQSVVRRTQYNRQQHQRFKHPHSQQQQQQHHQLQQQQQLRPHTQQQPQLHQQQNYQKRVVDIQWSGCSDNADFGTAISRLFVNGRENITGRNPMRALINLHNNNAGLKVN